MEIKPQLADVFFEIYHRPTKKLIKLDILLICEEYSTLSFKSVKYDGIGRLPSYYTGNDTAKDYDVYVVINGNKYLYDGLFYSNNVDKEFLRTLKSTKYTTYGKRKLTNT